MNPTTLILSDDGEFVLSRCWTARGTSLRLEPSKAEPALSTLAKLKHAFELRREVDSGWGATPAALNDEGNDLVLFSEDPGGASLAALMGRGPWDLGEFFSIAKGLASALDALHQRGLLHRDLKPSNLLAEVAAGKVWLSGFGLASRRSRGPRSPVRAESLVGSLAYIAPEQTGRINRSVDARSDLYSCGVILYEMLTGVLPFSARDAIEWIHCHVARLPAPPTDRQPRIPAVLGQLVLKLLAKDPDDRYQTASGLRADLDLCQKEWRERGVIPDISLGTRDIPQRLIAPEQLYGRDREIAALVAAFERVEAQGRPELVLISGAAGVGKSSLIRELRKAHATRRGLFAEGKFDHLKRDVPYSTLSQACGGLVRALLTQAEASLARWREEILRALAGNGRLVVDLVPELVAIIGPQPPPPELPPSEARLRYLMTLQRFIAVFARPERPLVLFVDDLQWVDPATLALLEQLTNDRGVRHLLLVGAYRDDEASEPLLRSLDVIRQTSSVRELALAALTTEHVEQLVADTLGGGDESAPLLAQLVLEKTAGNPFFALQFLLELHEDGLLTRSISSATWHWNADEIRARNHTRNVIDTMISRLNRVARGTQDLLRRLACIGDAVDASTARLVVPGTDEEFQAALWDARRLGLVRQNENQYVFTHDRVREASYGLTPIDERAAMHLAIGRVLADATPADALEEAIFDIVSQLNRGTALVSSEPERERLAALNLIAGTRAKAAAAHASALKYLATGEDLLAPNAWERDVATCFALSINRAECELLTGDVAAAEARLQSLATRARSATERAAVTSLRSVLYVGSLRIESGVAVALEYLRGVGVDWSPHPTEDQVAREYARTWSLLGSRPIGALLDAPIVTDEDHLATAKVLSELLAAAVASDANLRDLTLFHLANISIENGHCDASCGAYALMNMAFARFDNHAAGHEFGQLSVDLVEKRGLDRSKARVYDCFGCLVVPWSRPLRSGLPYIEMALKAAEDAGDLSYRCFASCHLAAHLFACGDALADSRRVVEDGVAYAQRVGFALGTMVMAGHVHLLRRLCGSIHGAAPLGSVDEDTFEEHVAAIPSFVFPGSWYWIRKLQAAVILGDNAASLEALEKAEQLVWATSGFLEHAEFHFYAALALAVWSDVAPPDQRLAALEGVARHYAKISGWCRDGAENFADRAALIAAEMARIEQRETDAERFYEQAIELARERGFVQNEALASERAGRFHEARGLNTVAIAYLRNARYAYVRWGAHEVVRQLDERYPLLRKHSADQQAYALGAPTEQLDLATVIKVSQAVSSEMELGRLIEKLMTIALEHAGAEYGVLLLPRAGNLRIVAKAETGRDGVIVRLVDTRPPRAALPDSVLAYVERTREGVLIDDARVEAPFAADSYFVDAGARSVLCLPLVQQGALRGVLYLENRTLSHAFTPSIVAVLKLLASQAAVSVENAGLYAEVRQTQAYLEQAQDLSHTGSFGWSPSTGELVWSKETFRIFGFEPTIVATLELARSRVHPDDLSRFAGVLKRAEQHPFEDWGIEHRLLMPDGSIKHVHVVAKAVESAGADVEFVGAVMDVTTARRAMVEKDSLLKEVHHRVKNNLQLVSSLLSLQASRHFSDPMAQSFREVRNRVRSIALVHENLYRSDDLARVPMRTHVTTMCRHLAQFYGAEDRIQLDVQVGEVHLELESAVNCGLIVNELVSNAFKHAFPSGRRGRIWVELGATDADGLVVVVADDGVGLPAEFRADRAESMGLQLVRDLTAQLRGAMTTTVGDRTRFMVTFPARH
ncbi:MAG TPA: AAA family ATPase [Polyangiaceae bacterium]|nr:AAA family ATPase [Polyangiaceae bacterium]